MELKNQTIAISAEGFANFIKAAAEHGPGTRAFACTNLLGCGGAVTIGPVNLMIFWLLTPMVALAIFFFLEYEINWLRHYTRLQGSHCVWKNGAFFDL